MRFTKPLISFAIAAAASTSAYALDQVTSFGSNPGNLEMFEYVPTSQPENAPMVVVLHGCTQTPETYNNLTGWETLAERYGFYMMLPKTTTANQAKGCFNWYEPGDFERGKGEALSIENMINTMTATHSIDTSRIYITGLSAGGIMALDLMSSYPDVFAGGATWSLAPANLARDLNKAMSLFYQAEYVNKTPQEWGDLARQLSPGYEGQYPKVSLIMGSNDERFDPRMLNEVMEQWTNLHGTDQEPEVDEIFRNTTHQIYENQAGEPVVEVYQVQGMIHGSSVDECDNPCNEDQGGDASYDYTWDHDLWSAYYSAKFLGLLDTGPKPLKVTITSPSQNSTVKDTITVTANASSDNEEVSSVEFYTNDNATPECTDIEAPYECNIDTTLFAEGDLAITAKAYAVTEEDEDTVNVTVQNIIPACKDWEATISSHETAGRAYSTTECTGTLYGTYCFGGDMVTTWYAEGSDESLGTNGNATVTLKEESQGIFEQGSCPNEDTVAPIITLVGDAEITIYQGQTYSDAGATATDNVDGDITANIAITGSVDTETVGAYELVFNVSDSAGNNADEVIRTVNVIADTIAPEITLNGNASMSVDLNGTFTDPGATALDNLDGDITANIVVTGNVDTSKSGTYELKYNVSDAAGNAATEVIRTVTVAADTVAPVITILGHNPLSIWQNDPFEDPGATATDNVDGDLTASIVVTGEVDNTTAGRYDLTYTVTDAAGNEAVKTRAVFVTADTSKPSLELLGDSEITIFVGDDFVDPGARSIDNRDGNISDKVIVTGTVDTGSAGTYELTYNVSDAAGNTATPVTRTVTVVADTEAPVITITGSDTITLSLGQTYNEPGANAIDNKDGDISANIIIENNIEADVPGTYEVSYNVSDSAGNSAEEVIRTVIILDAPICTDYTDTAANHETAGRAYSQTTTEGETCYGSFCWGGTEVTRWYANGSDDDMGTNGNASITLKEIEGGFEIGECPAEPTPPVIESYEVVTNNYYKAVITGIASDADGDINRVVLGLRGVTGIVCEGTTNFTCTLNWDDYGISVGGNVTLDIYAYDSREEMSNIETTFETRPESQAPEITPDPPQYTLNGSILTITVNVTDADDDIEAVQIVRQDDIGGISCENTTGDQYSCSVDLIGTSYATMRFKAMAVDLTDNLTESDEFTVEWYGEVESCFTASNREHYDNGRAELRYNVLYYANGSGTYLGQSSDVSSLEETSTGVWSKVNSCN